MLGNFILKIMKTPLQRSSLICQSPTKAIWWFILKTIYSNATCLALSFVKLLWPLREIFVMLSWSRFTCTFCTPLLCFYEKLALYHPLIPQNKCSTICVGLSLRSLLKKRREAWAIEKKNIWTHEGPSIEKKERKKCEHMKVHEKKKKKEIAMLSKEFI